MADRDSRRLHATTAKDVMTSPVTYVMIQTPVKEIASLMLRKGISAVPAIDDGGRLAGIVSEGDLIHRRAGDRKARRSWWLDLFEADSARRQEILGYLSHHGLRAQDVMSRDIVTVDEDTPVARVAETLDAHRIKRVPVLRGGRMTGIVSRADLLRALAKT